MKREETKGEEGFQQVGEIKNRKIALKPHFRS